ncbi:hypothetical protein Sjap_022376 [Stephania japonica]|uniref:Carboxypeptidase n=1 Tax=Stephania japonica TaxID=461633 RepID=A0AAP0EXL6_9MAGN
MKSTINTTLITHSTILICIALLTHHAYGDTLKSDPLYQLLKAKRSKQWITQSTKWESSTGSLTDPVFIASTQQGLKESDKIETLPGQPNVLFNHYSGYVTVDPKAGRALFYYFAEAPLDPSSKPLLLWLNGGPGCSSFGNGAMQELGPFRVQRNGEGLYENEYAWNKAGVGFSYSNTTSDYVKSGDDRTAKDSYTFLVNWLERFPEYKNRPFFIAGESYAGHYVPQLAQTILERNKSGKQTRIDLQGIAVGNALLEDAISFKGMFDFFWTHALISDEVHQDITRYCNFLNLPNVSDECISAANKAENSMGDIYLYNIYAPFCETASVGGYAVGYKNLTFVTVRGAGHLVPSYQPERALTLITSFLQGKLPPVS